LYHIIVAGLKFVSVGNFCVLDVHKKRPRRRLNLWSFNCTSARHVAATFVSEFSYQL